MKKSAWVWIVVIIIVLLGIWYISSHKSVPPGTSTTAGTQSTSSPAPVGDTTSGDRNVPPPPLLNVGTDVSLGKYLIGPNNMTLYMYSKDSKGVSTCTGTCAETWKPYIPAATLSYAVGAGVSPQADTIVRADGSRQLTYKGMPLYFYSGDAKAGDTKGNGIGGVWAIVRP